MALVVHCCLLALHLCQSSSEIGPPRSSFLGLRVAGWRWRLRLGVNECQQQARKQAGERSSRQPRRGKTCHEQRAEHTTPRELKAEATLPLTSHVDSSLDTPLNSPFNSSTDSLLCRPFLPASKQAIYHPEILIKSDQVCTAHQPRANKSGESSKCKNLRSDPIRFDFLPSSEEDSSHTQQNRALQRLRSPTFSKLCTHQKYDSLNAPPVLL